MVFDEHDHGIETLVSLTEANHDVTSGILGARVTFSAVLGKGVEILTLMATEPSKCGLVSLHQLRCRLEA